MIRAINASKATQNLLRFNNKYSFCFNFAPLDPRKHHTMSHNTHNMYLDLWEYGQYPDFVLQCSVPARTYESKVVDIIAQTLS